MNEKNDVHFECARPIEEDARLVMEWRNDPLTLRMSFGQALKKWEAFYPEFCTAYFSLPSLPPLFVRNENQRVAFIRFRPAKHPTDPHRRCCEISIQVAPEFRGKGVAGRALTEINTWVAAQGYDDIFAEVKEENVVSHQLFLSVGYRESGPHEKVVEGEADAVAIRGYLLALTPTKKSIFNHVYIIAEAGSNWRMGTPKRDRAMAYALIDAAVAAGADAVKFQTYRPETIYVHNAGASSYLADAGIVEDMATIFADLSMPYEMVAEIATYCKEKGIDFMSTPFSENDFDVVDPHVTLHKIASYEINHLRLIERAAKSGKPLILSTGAATEEEIAWAVDLFHKNRGKDLVLLQCTAKYPAESDSMNLLTIPWLKQRFKVEVGLSDHSRDPLIAPIAAVALGAQVIEKHFTLSNTLPGPDHFFAVTPEELKAMVRAIREAEKMRGSSYKMVDASEKELRAFARRGIQALETIEKGQSLREGKNIAILRPGNQQQGIHPRHIVEIEGKIATRTIPVGDGIQKGDWQ